MSDRQRLKEMWRPFAEAALPDDELRRRRAAHIAINDDGGVNEEAVYQALPWQPRDFSISGELENGVNAAQQYRVRQPSRLTYVDSACKTPPVGGSLVMELVIAGGSSVQTVTIVEGATFGVAASTAYIPIPAGSLLRLNILSASGAADVAVTAWLAPEIGGSTSSSGGGSGGGSGSEGGGGGAVMSVNGYTGEVTLNADDIDDTSTTHKFLSAAEKVKLASFETDDYVLASSLALVATSGNYDDLSNTPTLGTAAAANTSDFATTSQGAKADTAVQPGDLADVATSGDYNDLDDKPALGTAAAMNADAFATATQGAKADTAVQPGDLSHVATSGDYDDLDNTPTIPAQFNPTAGANVSITGTYPDLIFNAISSSGGGGDMLASTYDPTGKANDAFHMDHMAEGAETKILTAAERSKLGSIEDGAEVNVQSDWEATSGDAAILNKPTEFPPGPHDHDERYYTQAEVDAIIARVTPQTKHSINGTAFSGSTSGSYYQPGGDITFTDLDPNTTYKVSGMVMIRSTGSANRELAPRFRAVGATTEVSTAFGHILTSTSRQNATDSGFVTVKPNVNGEIVVTPGFGWSSGTINAAGVSLLVTVSEA